MFCEAQAGTRTWEILTTDMFSEVTKQSQMSCIRLQGARYGKPCCVDM